MAIIQRQPRDADADPAPVAGTPSWAPCRAPHSHVRFSPTGVVRPCCANETYSLGTVGEVTLRKVWEGEPILRLAAALDAGDYSLGCAECAPGLIADRRATPAAIFDRFDIQRRDEWPLLLEFALSNRCNLECVMCNGDFSSTIRVRREGKAPLPFAYGEDFFDQITPFLRHAEETTFIGGEPFLEPGCRRIWDQQIELGRPSDVHVTTNGTIAGDRVEHYLQSLRMDVAISIDAASREAFEAIRVGASFDRVIANRDRFLELTRSYGRGFAINFCLMSNNWRELAPMCLEADRIDVSLHVIPVYFPTEFSLLCLPDDEVADIIRELEQVGSEVRGQLGRNLDPWDLTLTMLRDHLQRAANDEVAVALRARQLSRDESAPARTAADAAPVLLAAAATTPAPPPLEAAPSDQAAPTEETGPPDDAAHQALVAVRRRQLHDHHGVEPVRIDLVDGIVERVLLPDWMASRGEALIGLAGPMLVLPGSDAPPTTISVQVVDELVSEGRLAIPVGGRRVAAELVVIRLGGTTASTVLVAPAERF